MIELMFSLAINVVPSPIKDAITNILGVRALMGTGKYLVLTSMVWKVPSIYNLFDVTTTQLILNTLRQPLDMEDKLSWKGEKSDNSHLNVLGLWKLIWKLKVCPKVKNFLWRVCHYCFPSLAHLISSKRVSCPLDFVLSNSSYEKNIHVL
ncbi:hypothetical protein MTR_7g029255 [Medicago truncatula]|uniref:Reverse transcriptase zinc-binding domain-containing protein n=1 Tax=Medicago truncatula TaxID=3880 RepID=A0A072U856_MEDTR|nr:hypothetical protein MTR_7g029255 [Medicago truncatula]